MKTAYWAVGWVLALGLIGSMEATDQKKEHELYCKMIAERTWPDYKGIARNECPKEGRNHGND